MGKNLFEQGSVSKNYICLSLPLVFSLIVSVIYNMADTYFIAWTQNTDLVAGVSLCVPVFTLLMAFGNIFGQGGSSLISRLLGKKDRENTRHVSSFCFYASLIFGLAAGIFMIAFRTPILHLLGADSDTFRYASEYYIVLSAGAPFITASFVHSNLLRSEGLTRESMFGSISGVALNIILDPIFISILGWGARGAAIASVIGYLFSDVFYLITVSQKSQNISLRPGDMKITGSFTKQIFGIGTSAALTNLMQSLALIFINQFLLPYGNDKIASMGIAQKVSMIALLILTGFSFGGQPIISYFYGAKNKEKLQELLRFAFRFMAALAVALTVILELAAPLILKGFLKDPDIVGAGTAMFRWQIISLIFVSVVFLITIIFQATGKVTDALIMSVCRQGILFFPILWIASETAGYYGILVSQAAADVLTAVIAVILFYKHLYKALR